MVKRPVLVFLNILGTLAIIGGLRAFNLDLPLAPGFVSPFVQIMFGIYIGGKITNFTFMQ
jgi:hypothetical protein